MQRPKTKVIYENDFGDNWRHNVVVEQYYREEPGVRYPRCIGGRRQCPPEDVGGMGGYETFLQAMADKSIPSIVKDKGNETRAVHHDWE